jgi:hypothetical protein
MEPLAEKIVAATATPASFRAKAAVAIWNCIPGIARPGFNCDAEDTLSDLLEASALAAGLGDLYRTAQAKLQTI